MFIYNLANKLIMQSQKATSEQLAWLVDQVSAAPFVEDLLEVDEPLWGGFWQGDVIGPGYSLPAVELALLRAIRLDGTWPQGTSVAHFLADLRQAISDPRAGVWTLLVVGEPCVVFASVVGQGSGIEDRLSGGGAQPLAVVAWYCATTERLHAGYRTELEALNFSQATEQRHPGFLDAPPLGRTSHRDNQPNWLEQVAEQAKIGGGQPSALSGLGLAAWLDTEILHIRQMG